MNRSRVRKTSSLSDRCASTSRAVHFPFAYDADSFLRSQRKQAIVRARDFLRRSRTVFLSMWFSCAASDHSRYLICDVLNRESKIENRPLNSLSTLEELHGQALAGTRSRRRSPRAPCL